MVKVWKNIFVLALLSCLFVGCLGETPVHYTMPNETMQTTTTTKHFSAPICDVDPVDRSCEDEKGIHYGRGMCVGDFMMVEEYICNQDTGFCELSTFDFNCSVVDLVCMAGNERSLDMSPLNVVVCGRKQDDPTWRPDRYIEIIANKNSIEFKQLREKPCPF